MSTKSELKTARVHLERERAQLRANQERLRAERLAMELERVRAVAALRELCATFGDNSWSDTDELAEIIGTHLGRPLVRLVADLRAKNARAERTPPPVSLRPATLPPTVHRCLTVKAQAVSGIGYRASCTCGWRSEIAASEPLAVALGSRHVDDRELRSDLRRSSSAASGSRD